MLIRTSLQMREGFFIWLQGSSAVHDTEIQARILVVMYFVSCVLYTFVFLFFAKSMKVVIFFFLL